MLMSSLLLMGCDSDSGPGSVMPSKVDGASGEHVTVTGLSGGTAVPCSKVSGDVWSFNVPFEATTRGAVSKARARRANALGGGRELVNQDLKSSRGDSSGVISSIRGVMMCKSEE